MKQPLLIGIDIGGTKIRLCTARPTSPHQLLYTVTIPTPRSFSLAQPEIEQAIEILLDGHPIAGIGVASPGPVDSSKGIIGHPTHLSWTNAPISRWLKGKWHCPVGLWNDATAAGICEAQYGNAKRYRYALYVSISTGIGSALMLDGWPLPGPHNQEGGRMILGTELSATTFQQATSGTAILRQYGRIAGKITNRQDWRDIGHRLAVGLHNLIVSTDPEVVILGGGVSLHSRKFLPELRRQLSLLPNLYPAPPIKPARYIEHAPLIGALAAIADQAGLASVPKPKV